MKFLKGLGFFICAFLIYHLIFCNFFPVDENNVLIAPDWYVTVGMIISLIVSIVLSNEDFIFYKKSGSSQKYSNNRITQEIPTSFKMQLEMAEAILSNITLCVSLANKTTSVYSFVSWYDKTLDDFAKLMKLDKVKFESDPSRDYYRIKDEFQWHLCDAIVRAKEKALSDIKVTYKNSRDFQERTAKSFENDVNSVKDRFSANTKNLAEEAITEVNKAAGLLQNSPSRYEGASNYIALSNSILEIDYMEGHDFEYWCADLLRKNNFVNVTVTQGSGDQGVDILAEKGGIKYAIQCKCYSKDLGNSPVQEVETGKKIYGCHVGAVMTNRYFTTGAKEAAVATGTLLWDRDWITAHRK